MARRRKKFRRADHSPVRIERNGAAFTSADDERSHAVTVPIATAAQTTANTTILKTDARILGALGGVSLVSRRRMAGPHHESGRAKRLATLAVHRGETHRAVKFRWQSDRTAFHTSSSFLAGKMLGGGCAPANHALG
jgi:hypothetical protein